MKKLFYFLLQATKNKVLAFLTFLACMKTFICFFILSICFLFSMFVDLVILVNHGPLGMVTIECYN